MFVDLVVEGILQVLLKGSETLAAFLKLSKCLLYVVLIVVALVLQQIGPSLLNARF
jgi:uncharacterized membrane protein YkvI